MAGWLDILPEASREAVAIDGLFLIEAIVCGAVTLLVVVLVVGFVVRYDARRQVNRHIDLTGHTALEYLAIGTMLVGFLAMFLAGSVLYFRANSPPTDTLQISIVGKQWMWKLQHPAGRREIDALTVPLGQPVKLVMTSEDVIHSFFLPAFRIKQDVLPERYTVLWFRPTRLGDFPIFCTQYCGTYHAAMIGRIHVVRPEAYSRWLDRATGADAVPMAKAGARLFNTLACAGCHGTGSTVHAPDLTGLWGRPVTLSDGQVILADDAYLRRSLLQPKADVVAGYKPVMPTYQGQIDEGQVFQLIAYLKSLSQPSTAKEAPP